MNRLSAACFGALFLLSGAMKKQIKGMFFAGLFLLGVISGSASASTLDFDVLTGSTTVMSFSYAHDDISSGLTTFDDTNSMLTVSWFSSWAGTHTWTITSNPPPGNTFSTSITNNFIATDFDFFLTNNEATQQSNTFRLQWVNDVEHIDYDLATLTGNFSLIVRNEVQTAMNIYTESSQTIGNAAFVSGVPVPAAVWLFGSALGLLGWMRRKTS